MLNLISLLLTINIFMFAAVLRKLRHLEMRVSVIGHKVWQITDVVAPELNPK